MLLDAFVSRLLRLIVNNYTCEVNRTDFMDFWLFSVFLLLHGFSFFSSDFIFLVYDVM